VQVRVLRLVQPAPNVRILEVEFFLSMSMGPMQTHDLTMSHGMRAKIKSGLSWLADLFPIAAP